MENIPLANNEKIVSEETKLKIEEILGVSFSSNPSVGEIFDETASAVDELLVNSYKNRQESANDQHGRRELTNAEMVEVNEREIKPFMGKVREVWDLLREDVKK